MPPSRFVRPLVAIAMLVVPVHTVRADDEVLARGPCYVKQFSPAELAKSPGLMVRRIEVQFNRFQPPRPGGEAANRQIEIGLTPRADDEAPSTASTGDCTGSGTNLVCTLSCDGHGEGRFKLAPIGKDRIRLTPEGPIAVDACFDGVPAFELPDTPEHKSFVLTLSGASDCFH